MIGDFEGAWQIFLRLGLVLQLAMNSRLKMLLSWNRVDGKIVQRRF
jgi:hypothetical protein